MNIAEARATALERRIEQIELALALLIVMVGGTSPADAAKAIELWLQSNAPPRQPFN